MGKHTVTFYPDNKKTLVESGTTILSAAISCRIPIDSSCGGDGVCGKCKIVVKKGIVHADDMGFVSVEERRRGVHLACLCLVESDMEVEVPRGSRPDEAGYVSCAAQDVRRQDIFGAAVDIVEAKPLLGDGLFPHDPFVSKIYLELPKPSFDDKISDLERLYRSIEEKIGECGLETSLANVRQIGGLLRASDWNVAAALGRRGSFVEVISVDPGERSAKNYGFAFDIGTTTLSAQLVDLNTRRVLGTKAVSNKQAAYGSDVITRIIYAQEEGGLEALHRAVAFAMNEMIRAMIDEHGVDLNDVTCAAVAGNTTMTHLLLRIDPTHIRQEPYIPAANVLPVMKAHEAGIAIHPHGLLFCLPGVASYVGGDITAGVVACDIRRTDGINLLIDIGTNGEIVLGGAEWLISCAASAGPAFEGSGMSCGLRASRGAIQDVGFNPKTRRLEYTTIGGDKPSGICGSGYISLVSKLLECGVLDKNGRINTSAKDKRLRRRGDGAEYVVVFAEESATGCDIVLTEGDLDNLKRAKAAIYAAISILLRHMGVAPDSLGRIFVAGGFGTSLDIDCAVRIGLLPDVARDKFVFVGNSALAGARLCLLSSQAMETSKEVARGITYFELSTDAEYMDEYTAALFFPHTDLGRFPSVHGLSR